MIRKKHPIYILLFFMLIPVTLFSHPYQIDETIEKFFMGTDEILATTNEWQKLQVDRLTHMGKILLEAAYGTNYEKMESYYFSINKVLSELSNRIYDDYKVYADSFKAWEDSQSSSNLPEIEEDRFVLFRKTSGKEGYNRFSRSYSRKYKKAIAEVIKWNEKWYTGPMLGRDNKALEQEKKWRKLEKELFDEFKKVSAPFQEIREDYIPKIDIEIETGNRMVTTSQIVQMKLAIIGGTPPFKLTIAYNDNGQRRIIKREGQSRTYTIPLDFNDTGNVRITMGLDDSGTPPQALMRYAHYTVAEPVKPVKRSSREDRFYGKAVDLSKERSEALDKSFGATKQRSETRQVVAFGIQPKNPAAVKVNASGTYQISSGETIQFRAYVTYSDDVSSPVDLTEKIAGAKGWVNGPVFNKTRPGIYRVSADFSSIGKGKITARVIVR